MNLGNQTSVSFFLCNPTLLVSHLVHSVGLDPLVALESLPGRSR